MPVTRRTLFSSAVLAAALLCGCSQPATTSVGQAAPAQSPAAPPSAPLPSSDRASPSTGRSAGKPTAPVDLAFELDSEPRLNQVVVIDLKLTPQVSSSALRVSFVADPGLALVSGGGETSFGSVAAGMAYSHRISVMPQAGGALNVHVIAQMALEDAPNVRTFSIPIRIGTANLLRKPRSTPVDATGQPIESMPAEIVER